MLRGALEGGNALIRVELAELGQPLVDPVVYEDLLLQENAVVQMVIALLHIGVEDLVLLAEDPAEFRDEQAAAVDAGNVREVARTVVDSVQDHLAEEPRSPFEPEPRRIVFRDGAT